MASSLPKKSGNLGFIFSSPSTWFRLDRQQDSVQKSSVDSNDTFECILSPKDLSFKEERKFQIGHGYFGAVYTGEFKGKACAVKVFFEKFTDKTFEYEARTSALSHPHIVKVHGLCDISDGDSNKPHVALVMDLCDGNLASYLAEKAKAHYSLAHKLMILQQVAEAIIYLHGKRIVHGDLSAANILMVNSSKQPPNVKIADFGRARVLNPDTLKHQTNTRGRDDFMPPEILYSSTDVVELTTSVDLFSFGCLVPYVATCKYPTPAEIGSAFERRVHHLNSLTEVQQRIFEGTMRKCLDERPHWRGTFEEVHERLAPEVNKYVVKRYPISMEEKNAEIQKLKGEVQRQQQQVGKLKESLSCSEVKCTELQRQCSEVELLLEKAQEKGALAEEREKQIEDYKRKLEDSKESIAQFQQLKDRKEELEKEITILKGTLSKDGQSRMLAEIHKLVKSRQPEQMSAFGKDSAKLLSVLKEKDELIANQKKTITEWKSTYAADLYKITMTMATKEDMEASIWKLWKEGGTQGEIKVEKLLLSDFQGQLAEKQSQLDSVENQLSSLSLEKKNLEDELARQKTTQAGLKEVVQSHSFKQKQSTGQIQELGVMLEKLSERNQEKERELQGQVAILTKLNQRLSIRNTELLGLKDKSKANENALETISLGSKAPERDLMKHCWLPFGLQTMVVEAEGAPVYLHPPPPAHVTQSEAVLLPPVSLEAPFGCINTEVCSKLYLRYGIVVWGPYSLPEGLQLASVGVYIYFDPAHCVNPLILRIPHWSGSEEQGKLKSVVASLLLEGGGEGEGKRYRFEEFGSEGLTVSGAVGSMLLPLPGSGIYCLVQKEGAPSRYIASSFETNGTGGSNLDVRFTYHSSVWMQILDKHFPKPSSSVRFQFKEDRLQGQMERTSGGGWRACVVGTGVTEQEQCEYGFAGLKNGRELLSAVQKGVYPPAISCRTEYSSPLRETGARSSAVMVVSGVKGAPLTFGVTTYEYITVRKSPLGTESDSTPTAQTPPTTAVTVLHPSSVATSPVRVTSSVQATSPVRVTSSVQATRPPVQATLPSTTAESVRQRPSSLAASLVAMIDLDSNEDASSSQNAKRFCLRNLMPFVAPLSQDFEALAHHMHIAGELKERVVVEAEGNRYSQLQKLFTAWLSEGDSEEAPHNWEFFISVVRRIGKPGLAEEIAKLVYV